jgi:hypothetical protein
VSIQLLAQKEKFDLVTYTPPVNWKKEAQQNVVGYTFMSKDKKTFCQVGIYRSTTSKGSIELDFESEWNDLVVKTYKPSVAPEANEVIEADGWKVKSGASNFSLDGGTAMVLLTTMSGFNRVVSIIALTNSQDYLKDIEAFLSSIDLEKPKETPPPAVNNTGSDNSILGTWGASASDQSDYRVKNGVMNYIKRQYTFNTDGTYRFVTKAFDPLMDKLILGKENGTFQINGNSITLSPQKSVLESWTKKEGGDDFGKQVNSQSLPLEKTTYQFRKHYFSGIQETDLVLQADKPTKRDGPFSGNTVYSNAWYYGPISKSNPLIEFPGQNSQAGNTSVPAVKPSVAKADGFQYTTTNFDDGWTSTVQEDWVQVTKGTIKILVHYPNKKSDEYNPDVMGGLKNAWNILVAPRYSSAANMVFKPVSSFETIDFAEADLTEMGSGKVVHVVFFKKNFSNGAGKYIEFITPDKATFEREFGVYSTESYADIWTKMANMAGYNKFAVAPSDLKGKWTNDFSGFTQYVNAYTGNSAGMDTHSSAQEYTFGPGATYKWQLSVASGFVGNIKFQSVKSNGKFSNPSIWQVHFSDLEGKPKTYNVSFSCIKGARVLWIDGTAFGKDSSSD